MVRAAAGGVIDFSKARPTDHMWQLKVSLLLRELAHQENVKLAEVWQRRCEAKVQLHADNVEARKNWLKHELTAFNDLLAEYACESHKHEDKKIVDMHRNAWVESFGDPKDPTVAASIDAVASAMMAKQQKSRLRSR